MLCLLLHQEIVDDDIVSLSDTDKKPQASICLEKKTEVVPSLENKGMMLENIIQMQH